MQGVPMRKPDAYFSEISRLKGSEQRPDELFFRLQQQIRILDITLSSISDFAYIFGRGGLFIFANA
jgi:hypothetical protein